MSVEWKCLPTSGAVHLSGLESNGERDGGRGKGNRDRPVNKDGSRHAVTRTLDTNIHPACESTTMYVHVYIQSSHTTQMTITIRLHHYKSCIVYAVYVGADYTV